MWLDSGYTLKTKQTSFAYSLDAGMREEGQARMMPRAWPEQLLVSRYVFASTVSSFLHS